MFCVEERDVSIRRDTLMRVPTLQERDTLMCVPT